MDDCSLLCLPLDKRFETAGILGLGRSSGGSKDILEYAARYTLQLSYNVSDLHAAEFFLWDLHKLP